MMMLDLGRPRVQMPGMLIYKVFRAAEWQALQDAGETRGAPVDLADGFVHFSAASQLAETLSRHFPGETELTLLACDGDALGEALRWEPSRGGDLFPHLYRALRMGDVLWARDLPLGPEGHEIGDLR